MCEMIEHSLKYLRMLRHGNILDDTSDSKYSFAFFHAAFELSFISS